MIAWVIGNMEDVYQEKMINLREKWKPGVLTCPRVSPSVQSLVSPFNIVAVEVPA